METEYDDALNFELFWIQSRCFWFSLQKKDKNYKKKQDWWKRRIYLYILIETKLYEQNHLHPELNLKCPLKYRLFMHIFFQSFRSVRNQGSQNIQHTAQ